MSYVPNDDPDGQHAVILHFSQEAFTSPRRVEDDTQRAAGTAVA